MKTFFEMIPTLVLPGWHSSNEAHWQTRWEEAFGWTRVQQKDWDYPRRKDWLETIVAAVHRQKSPPLVVTHSLGGIALAHAAPALKIRAAFIVAPPDLEKPGTPPEIIDFHPTPLEMLPFPSLFVASDTDPYCEIERAERLARHWGSTFKNVGDRHHIGDASNVGFWEEGQALLKEFLSTSSPG